MTKPVQVLQKNNNTTVNINFAFYQHFDVRPENTQKA